MVRKTGREAFNYGPKTVNDLIRAIALNAEHSIRDVIRDDYPRSPARMLLHAPRTYQVVGDELRITVRPPDRGRRFAQAAKHVVGLLSSLGLPHLHPIRRCRCTYGCAKRSRLDAMAGHALKRSSEGLNPCCGVVMRMG